MRPGGLYAVEDLQTAEVGDPRGEGTYTERNVSGVTFHHNIACVEKGLNAEEGGPEFLRTIG